MKYKLLLCSILCFSINSQANEVDNLYKNGSAKEGQILFESKNKGSNFESCTACHTNNPKVVGKHAKTGKDIEPMATIVNPNRFTDLAKVEKWFKRNCNDVLKRECLSNEKSNVIAYLKGIK